MTLSNTGCGLFKGHICHIGNYEYRVRVTDPQILIRAQFSAHMCAHDTHFA